MRKLLVLTTVLFAAVAAPAGAAPLALGPVSLASTGNPFAPGCGGPGAATPGVSVLYDGAEVEPHIAVDPRNGAQMVGGWQQDRWNDGGAQGLAFSRSGDGGASWSAPNWPAFSRCAGGTQTSAVQGTTLAPRPSDYQRATDPWLSYGPAGRVHSIAIGFDNDSARNAILAAYSDDNGATWSAPREVRFDNPRAVGNAFNDKQTLTADPTRPTYVYATWQRIISPSERASQKGYENAASFYSQTYFARSTTNGMTWEPARAIFTPQGRLGQTIGNEVEVLPDGTLLNLFNRIQGASNRKGQRGYNVALVRSTDAGETWSRAIQIDRLLVSEVEDPDDGHPVRTGDIIPMFGVDRSNTATSGTAYAVWMDTRFNDPDHNDILLSRSTDGGRTWSEPVVVDQTPQGVDAFTANVDVDATGRVAVSYYDFREDEAGDGVLSTDLWIAHSHDGGQTFAAADEVRVTPQSFDMRTAPDARGYFVGDYTGLDHFGNVFSSLYVAANDGNLANRTDAFHRGGQ